MITAIMDIETPKIDTLVRDIDEIFCIAIKVNDEPTKCYGIAPQSYLDGLFADAMYILSTADIIVGHNIIKFDIPVIENVLGKVRDRYKHKICDTLIDAKLCFSYDELLDSDSATKDMPKALYGSYSLKAFGYRFGLNKIEFDNFDTLTPSMVEYCKRDVDLTYKLYNFLKSYKNYPSEKIRECEYLVAKTIYHQEDYGFYFDIDKARELSTKLRFNKMNIEHKLLNNFPPRFVADGNVVIPNKAKKSKIIVPIETTDEFINIRPFKIPLSKYKDGRYKFPAKSKKYLPYQWRVFYQNTDGAYQKIKLQRFNPSSRQQVVERLISDYGWKPTNYTLKGSIKLEFK